MSIRSPTNVLTATAGGILRPTDPWDAHDAAIAHRDFLVVHDQVSTEVRAFKWYLLMEEGKLRCASLADC